MTFEITGSFVEQAGGAAVSSASDCSDYCGNTQEKRSSGPIGGHLKRGIDILICLIIIVTFSPLFLGLVAIIKLTDRGPVLYGHSRVGYNGRTFKCWKFRSMVTNGDEVLARHLARSPADREQWERERKLDRDPRITPIGAVLRKLSLDELPQVLNVLTGEMSIVGPRPVVFSELEKYEGSLRHYLRARPGITGLWQVSGRSNTTYHQRVKLDRYYVSKWNPYLDLGILIRTVPAVVLTHGAR